VAGENNYYHIYNSLWPLYMGYNQYETLKKKQKSKLLGVEGEGKNDFLSDYTSEGV